MKIPYVIDNDRFKMVDILNGLLSEYQGHSMDVASAYFTVGGFGMLQQGMEGLGSFRFLMGAEPVSGDQIGLKPAPVGGRIRKDIEILPFSEKTLRLVEDLIAFLRRESIQVRLYEKGFLHAKCWLLYLDRPGSHQLFDRFRPLIAIVGSSNFTAPGLVSNRELNLAHKVLLSLDEVEDYEAALAVRWLEDQSHANGGIEGPASRDLGLARTRVVKSEVGARAIIDLENWYERQWAESRDFKDELVALLDESKFGRKEYSPYEVYMKALYEYFRDDLFESTPTATRSGVELAEFQEDAVKKARRILSRYDGVMIADSVGLGKTWIGKKILEDFAYHLRQKALVVCPASLRSMWKKELQDSAIAAAVLSQEELGREDFEATPWGDADVILVDESHNFRNRGAQRYANLELILGKNAGRGKDGSRKKVILLTATPINNDLLDLYQQLSLITRGDRSYFAGAGIGDLHRYFLQARRDARNGGAGVALFNLLEEIVIRRTRPFIRKVYPDATIRGKKISFPERKLRTVRYDLEGTYKGIYDEVVTGIESLRLAPYNLEAFKKKGIKVDEFEAGREQALVGIFKSRYLKRFESSIEAFRISVRRALAFLKTFESYVLEGRLLQSSDFHKAIRFLDREDEEDDATPVSLADAIDEDEEARRALEGMEKIDPSLYDLRKLHQAVQHDVEVLSELWRRVKEIGWESDLKLQRLKDFLANELKGQKVLIFSYYKDTARYLYRHLGYPDSADARAFREQLGGVLVRRMDSGEDAKTRIRIVKSFAPRAHDAPELIGTEHEIAILISTDVLSEGQNLQDCGFLVNYDLHWNPTRMVQRAGRIDRIGTEFDKLWIYNVFPDEGLERLLGLVESLNRKIGDIDRAGFLDASVLGEVVHPKNFNTLRRILDEDGGVLEEEEQFTELASNEFLLQQIRALLESGGQESLQDLPDGIHSGLIRRSARGVFFYFQAAGNGGKQHFWRYLDLKTGRVMDNRFLVAGTIACERDTPRIVDPEMFKDVFTCQETVISGILQSVADQKALEAAPRTIDPIQQTIVTVIQSALNHPSIDRKRAIEAIRFLNQPMLTVQVRELRETYKSFQANSETIALLEAMLEMEKRFGAQPSEPGLFFVDVPSKLKREDLKLICFDFISG
jgi:superfamily II DNA or RNA helicase